MTGSAQITFIVFFEMTFFGLMTLLGLAQSTGASDQLQFLMSIIFAPWPQFNGPNQPCTSNKFNFFCAVFGGDIVGATALIGDGIFYLGNMAFSFFTRMNAVGQVFSILFNPSIANSIVGIPFVSSILLGMFIILGIAAIMIIRGNPGA